MILLFAWSKLILSFLGTLCLDIRQEQCFTRYKHGQCSNHVEGLYNKNLCCCSPIGKAWGGDKCEACPRPGTQAFQELCPKGSGFLDRKDINECTEFPGMCTNGRCKNSIGSYNCRCNKGYALDEFKIKCIGEYHRAGFGLPNKNFNKTYWRFNLFGIIQYLSINKHASITVLRVEYSRIKEAIEKC